MHYIRQRFYSFNLFIINEFSLDFESFNYIFPQLLLDAHTCCSNSHLLLYVILPARKSVHRSHYETITCNLCKMKNCDAHCDEWQWGKKCNDQKEWRSKKWRKWTQHQIIDKWGVMRAKAKQKLIKISIQRESLYWTIDPFLPYENWLVYFQIKPDKNLSRWDFASPSTPGPPTHQLSTVQHRQTQSYFCSFFSVCHVNREKFTFYAIRACNYQRMRQIRMIHANLIKTKMRLFLSLSLSLALCVVVVYAIGIVIFRVNSSVEYFFYIRSPGLNATHKKLKKNQKSHGSG